MQTHAHLHLIPPKPEQAHHCITLYVWYVGSHALDCKVAVVHTLG